MNSLSSEVRELRNYLVKNTPTYQELQEGFDKVAAHQRRARWAVVIAFVITMATGFFIQQQHYSDCILDAVDGQSEMPGWCEIF